MLVGFPVDYLAVAGVLVEIKNMPTHTILLF
jgi:hypothetical protein